MKDITIMRISRDLVIQLVESDPPKLVIVKDSTGDEIALTPVEVTRLRTAISYFEPFLHETKPMAELKKSEKCPACGADYDSLDTRCFAPDLTKKSIGWADRYCGMLHLNINADGSVVDK